MTSLLSLSLFLYEDEEIKFWLKAVASINNRWITQPKEKKKTFLFLQNWIHFKHNQNHRNLFGFSSSPSFFYSSSSLIEVNQFLLFLLFLLPLPLPFGYTIKTTYNQKSLLLPVLCNFTFLFIFLSSFLFFFFFFYQFFRFPLNANLILIEFRSIHWKLKAKATFFLSSSSWFCFFNQKSRSFSPKNSLTILIFAFQHFQSLSFLVYRHFS